MNTVIIVVTIAAVAALIASTLNKRKPAPPSQSTYGLPTQLDRADFTQPTVPWLVVAFTSDTCDACANIVDKVRVLASRDVAVDIVAYPAKKALQERYKIDSVPLILMTDSEGVVKAHFAGPASATDIWAAIAELREPGSTPPPEAHTHSGKHSQ